MKKFLTLLCVTGMALSAVAATGKGTLDDRLESSRVIINEIMKTPDQGIPNAIMKQATCVAVVPGLKKAAFVFGGRIRAGSRNLPHRPWMERAGFHSHGGRILRTPDRRPGY